MTARFFALAYVVLFVGARVVARLLAHRQARGRDAGAVIDDRVNAGERLVMAAYLAGGLVLPLLALGPWLPGFRYSLPEWASWAGLAILAGALYLHVSSIADLGRSYSATVRAREHQPLVRDGVYAWVRHPIYASLWLVTLAQPLLVHHVVFGFAGLLGFALLYFYRLPREEGMMLDRYGDEYREYMRRVGGLVPRLRRRP
ncbi:MAG: isoprenylcysteine carboxylmethyltransferase family protein [Gemmatimonadaceae bacterium]|nr:isoprenylcysteine carboxylmethyltransferase family protein [Gemmatimonadaceae bacterium]